MTYEACVQYLKAHIEQVNFAEDSDPHYTETLDIINAENGRLMSYIV